MQPAMCRIFVLLPCALGSTIRGRHVRGGSTGVPLGLDPKKDAIKMPPRGSDPKDPMCLANTGFKCGDGKNKCNDWVACSEETHTCTCYHWGCADSAGSCRPTKNQWFPNDNRLMPTAAAKPGSPHRFVAMNATRKAPALQDGWPAGEHPAALWKFLVMNDNATFLIATKQGQLQSDGYFLALPPAPWQENLMIAPIQVKPEDALQASWRLVERPLSRTAFQHISSGRFLCYDSKTDGLSTCASKYCEANVVDFEIWPKIVGMPMLTSEAVKLPGAKSSSSRTADKKEPASLYPKKKGKSVPKTKTKQFKLPGANSSSSRTADKKETASLYPEKKGKSKPKQNTSDPWYLGKNNSQGK